MAEPSMFGGNDNNFDNDFEKVSVADEVTDFLPHEVGRSTTSNPEPLIQFEGNSLFIQDLHVGESAARQQREEEKSCTTAVSCCSLSKCIDPRVADLIYWRDVKKSGVVFGSSFVLLLSLALFSVLSVTAYLALITLTITVSFRLYKNIMGAVQKTGEGNPFKKYLEMEMSLGDDKLHKVTDIIVKHVTCTLTELRRLILVDDIVDSLKFGLFLWVLTYIGAWFNGMTLIILADVAIFSLPKVYTIYKVEIDENVDLVKAKIHDLVKQVKEKIPLPGKKKKVPTATLR